MNALIVLFRIRAEEFLWKCVSIRAQPFLVHESAAAHPAAIGDFGGSRRQHVLHAMRIVIFVLMALSVVSVASAQDDDDYNNEVSDLDEPEFVNHGRDLRKDPGEEATFPCQVNELPEDFQLMWRKDESEILKLGTHVFTKDSRISFENINGNEGEILKISDLQDGDAGVYECVLTSTNQKSIRYVLRVGAAETSETRTNSGCHVIDSVWSIGVLLVGLVILQQRRP